MKFWFGSKKETTPEEAPQTVAEPVVSVPSEPVADESSTIQIPTPAPRLGEAPRQTASVDTAQPLQPATTLVRPQANQKVLYYQLMNGLYDAVLILDDNGHIVDCNNRVETVLGYNRDEMWDMPVSDVVKGIGPQIFQQMKDALHGNHQVLINAKCTRKDGVGFQGEVGVCIMHLTRGENLVFTIRNVEKRIAAMREQLLKELKPSTTAAEPTKPRLVLKKVAHPAAPAAPQA
ncbi:MAG: PAS domain S-box protein [bacterium]|nr:PAS domain S-box protein [bacterium]